MLMEQGERKFWSRKGQGSAKGRNEWREGRGRTRKVRVEKDGACISLRRGGGSARGKVNGCKKQVFRRLPQIAASCSRLQQAAAGCNKLPQVAAGCNRLRLESESESNPNRNRNPNRSRESNPSCFPRGQQGARAGECSFPREKTKENGEGRKGALIKGMAGQRAGSLGWAFGG